MRSRMTREEARRYHPAYIPGVTPEKPIHPMIEWALGTIILSPIALAVIYCLAIWMEVI